MGVRFGVPLCKLLLLVIINNFQNICFEAILKQKLIFKQNTSNIVL